ncbi:MAG TPA: AAA family ATPase, partial [Aggregatilineaceae bacterium]|nr:AAA family ATPase [Aggregatilineaceae bacterium]
MSTRLSPLHIRIFLSSPGDVADERSVALQVLERVQYDPLLRGQITVEVIAWDKPGADTPLLATMTPQEAINQGLPTPAECDIVVVIFWARMGTPLPDEYVKPDGSRYLSGTEWEYENALQASRAANRPLVVVYRRMQDVSFNPRDPDFGPKVGQWQRVEAFFAAFVNPDGSIRQGHNQYQTPDDFREKFETHLRGLVKRLLEEPPPSPVVAAAEREVAPLWEGSPFPGLRAFTPADAPIFFGRGAETDALVRRLSDPGCRKVAVVGASGSGKSSLVGAGLIPRLAANAIEGSRDWAAVRFTPGELASGDPFEALVVALVRDLPALRADGVLPRVLTGQLHEGPEALGGIVEQALGDGPAWAELVVFIDQFEELFSLVKPPHVLPFIDLLGYMATAPRVRTVLTLRADFYAKCVEYPALADLLETTTYPLAAPEVGALHEMVARPADLAGLTFETGLVDRVLDDTGMEPGALALMAYALDELYRECTQAECLTHAAYQALGGVRGAIGERAESTFAALDPEAQASLPDVFRELAEVDERGVAIRRRAGVAQVARTAAARRLVDALTGARLLVQGQGEDEQPVVEVAHEALLRSWTRLAGWIEDTQDDLRLLRQVRLGAEDWDRAGRNPADVLMGTRLERVRAWLETDGLTPLQRQFLEASVAEDERRKENERERHARELALQQRAANRLRYLLVMAVASLPIVILSVLAFSERGKAQHAAGQARTQAAIAGESAATATVALGEAAGSLRQLWEAQALYLAARSQQQTEQGNKRQAVLLALGGLAHYPDGIFHPENHQALLDALAVRGLEKLQLRHEGSVSGAVWSANGTRVLTWSSDSTARVWDAADGELLLTLRHEYWVNGAAWNGDETRILTWSDDGTARVWDAVDGTALLTVRHEGSVNGAVWNGDETRLLTWSNAAYDCAEDCLYEARVWDAADGTALLTLRHESYVYGAAWNRDETRLLTWSGDGTARVWDAADGELLLTLRHADWVGGAAWNRDE